MDKMHHRSGFVNILGNPNVGKSTLMNGLVGAKLSIITSKAQTTRHRIMGIVNGDDFQIVFSDTPGIIRPAYKLQEKMMKFVRDAVSDADVMLYVTDIEEDPGRNKEYLEKLRKLDIPVLLIINKVDLGTQEKVENLMEQWNIALPGASIIPVSAKEGYNLERVFNEIMDKLPDSPPYYPKDALTDKPERFFASEIIREKIFLNYRKEIPYSVEVEIEEFREGDGIIRIRAVIHVLRETQKVIIIGKRGEALKKTGTQARIEMEKFFENKVFLEIFVKVSKDWRDKEFKLKGFGYK